MIKIFFDMDGVLALFNKDASIEELNSAGYYRNLPIDAKACRLSDALVKEGFEVSILSKYFNNGLALPEKKEWKKEYISNEISEIYVPYEKDKSEYIDYNSEDIFILIDDFTPNLREWEGMGDNFIGIKYFNGINGTKGTWDGYSISNKMTFNKMLCQVVYLLRGLEGAA